MDERKFIIIVSLALVTILGAGLVWWMVLPKRGRELTASGTIEATEVVVSSKVGGTVLKLLVEEGNKVGKGEIIAQLDNSELSAVYKQAKANSVLAYNNLKRAEELSNKGYASPQALDQARASYDAAKANEDRLR